MIDCSTLIDNALLDPTLEGLSCPKSNQPGGWVGGWVGVYCPILLAKFRRVNSK